MKLYSAPLSPNAMRARAVAYELDLDFELVEIDLRNQGNKTPQFLAVNPNGKVPVLDDDGFVLWESRAIMAYLASIKPERGLIPTAPTERAVVDQWLYWQAIHLGPAMQRIMFERLMKAKFGMGEADEDAIQSQIKDVDQFLPILEEALKDRQWIAGALSIADFALASTFVVHERAGMTLDKAPNIAAWTERMGQRPSWQKAIAPVLEMAAK